MKSFNGFEEAQKNARYTGGEKLPAGAYVCQIIGVKLDPGKDGNFDMLIVQFDVKEGDYAGFFKKQYDENTNENKKYKGQTRLYVPTDDGSEKDGWAKNALAKWTNALEDSNSGYKWDWDEKKWKNKILGLVFGETGTVIEGKEVTYTECRFPVSADVVRAGKAPEAKFKAKNGYGNDKKSGGEATDFMDIKDGIDEELPF
jgi:hypothetical protein